MKTDHRIRCTWKIWGGYGLKTQDPGVWTIIHERKMRAGYNWRMTCILVVENRKEWVLVEKLGWYGGY
jgi:hypothetical protein